MAFNFLNAQSVDSSREGFLFKTGVKYAYFKAEENRPITFRILPAFSEHEGPVTNKLDYVPAVTIVGGRPVINDWIFAILTSKSYLKGSTPVVSRRTLVERNSDGTIVRQEDPLTQVIDYCSHNQKEWGYIVTDQGKWGDPNRIPAKLPPIKPQYVMNVITFDDEKPGVKLAVISSVMAINDLCRTKEGNEGAALKQTPFDVSAEEIERNPSSMFQYGDITDPNGAPIFKYAKGLSDDGGKKVYRINVGISIEPATGRQRVERIPVTPDDMAARQDLAHPETYVNIPTCEEQVKQLVRIMTGRNADGYHELEMLRVAIHDYASLIPEIPAAPGAVNSVRGASFEPSVQPAKVQPAVQAKPVAAPIVQMQQAQPVTARPTFVPTLPKQAQPVAVEQPQAKPVSGQSGIAGVAGEAKFNSDDWYSQAIGG